MVYEIMNQVHNINMTIIKDILWKAIDYPGLRLDTWIVTNDLMVQGHVARLTRAKVIGVDTETTGLDPLINKARIRLLQLTTEDEVILFDLFGLSKEAIARVIRFLEDPARVKVFQNGKFDLKFLIHEYNIGEVTPLFDTMIAAQLIDLGDAYADHGLGHLVATYLEQQLDKDIDHNWGGELTPRQLIYASNDASVLPLLRKEMLTIAKERGLLQKFGIEFGAVQPTAQREINGMLLNRARWMRIYETNKKKLITLDEKLTKMLKPMVGDNMSLFEGAPSPFKISNPQEMKTRLTAMGIKLPTAFNRDTKVTKVTLLMDKLAQISSQDPIISVLIERAKVWRAATSYGKKFLRNIHSDTNRAHPDIRQIGTVTTRETASDPPAHGIPKESDHRECFIAPSGWKLVWADYSQIELRILAELSNDINMLKAFNEGLDLHTQAASLIFGVDYESVVTIQRRRAKDINFGKPYGVGPERFAERAGISVEAAEKMMSDHDKKYPQSNAYLKSAASHARIYGWVRTMSGALITFKFDKNNKMQVAAVGRHGRNYPIQGSSADITKTAIRLVHDGIKIFREDDGTWPIKLMHVVHDEIVLEVRDDHVELATAILHASMVKAGEKFLKIVPVIVDVSVNTYWAKAKAD